MAVRILIVMAHDGQSARRCTSYEKLWEGIFAGRKCRPFFDGNAGQNGSSLAPCVSALVLRAPIHHLMVVTCPTYVAYTGSSMEPLFKPGDILQVIPYASNKIRYGDVIFYSCPSGSCNVVNRVKGREARGIRTKGDNNRRVDPRIVLPHQVVGYVAHALSGQHWRRIRGGDIGSFTARNAGP